MNQEKIARAIERLELNLPLRRNQADLPQPLRRLHQEILRYYLEHGHAPAAGDIESALDWDDAVRQLAESHIVVTDGAGRITGAYPFVDEAREFRVLTDHGQVRAMCAFDALAVSGMFALPTRVESRCRISGQEIRLEQDGADIVVAEPAEAVIAAIDWNASAGAGSCSATLCTEMFFIAGEGRAEQWAGGHPDRCELFELDEAYAFIITVFGPLMR